MIRVVDETGSTNDDMALWAAEGAVEGSWLVARRQTGGRGRLGRLWASPTGNLHASGLVRLMPGDPPAPTLALVAGLAVRDAVRGLLPPGAHAMIKWPNDLLLDGAKIAGVLLDRRDDAVVIGVGINLVHAPGDVGRPTTSVAAAGGLVLDPAEMVEHLRSATRRWLGRWRAEGLQPICRAWLDAAHGRGTPLMAQIGDRSFEGLFDGLDHAGALRLKRADGAVMTVAAGDVFLI